MAIRLTWSIDPFTGEWIATNKVLDEDDFASDSDRACATQQSIKKYVYDEIVAAFVPAGADTQIQFNDGGVFGGSAGFTYDGTDLTIVGDITAGNISGSTSGTNTGDQPALENRIMVGDGGDYATIKEAVDWFNASATCDTQILIDACHHLVADTITVNNGSYNLFICGLGSAVTFLDASTGLTGKPMFDLQSACDFHKMGVTGSTLANYGDLSTEVFIKNDTTVSIYSEITDIFVDTFYTVVQDLVGMDLFVYNYYFYDCTSTAIEINHTGTGDLDTEIGTIENIPVGIDFVSASVNQSTLISGILFKCPVAGTGIEYDGTTVVPDDRFSIIGCDWNYVGDFVSGFDFTRQDARDAGITIKSCIGISDQTPYFKINLSNGTAATTCTTKDVYYRAAGFRQLMHVHCDAVATGGTFTLTIGALTTGAIAWNATPATTVTNIQTAVQALATVTAVTVTEEVANKEWTIRFDTGGEGFEYPFSGDATNLTSVTTIEIIPSFFVCKSKVGDTAAGTSNRMTNLAPYPFSGVLFVNGNMSVNANGENLYIGVKANGTGEIISPYYVRTKTSGTPYQFGFTMFIEEMNENDYFEFWVSNASSAGKAITVSDITIYGTAR